MYESRFETEEVETGARLERDEEDVECDMPMPRDGEEMVASMYEGLDTE